MNPRSDCVIRLSLRYLFGQFKIHRCAGKGGAAMDKPVVAVEKQV